MLLEWEPARLYRKLMSDPAQADWFCHNICTLEWHTEHDRGVPLAENARRLIDRHPEYKDLILSWNTGWLDMFHGYVEGVPDILEALLRRPAPVYALTNFPGEKWDETVAAFPLLKTFRDVVVSSTENMVKPDPRIFKLTLERMGSPDPADVFFIDDREDNTQAAAALGFRTHRFTHADALRRALRSESLL